MDEIYQVGLINRHQTLSLNRLMVHAKELPVRMQILQLIEEGHPACRRLFVDYHGLPIIWSWMVDCTPEQDELKTQVRYLNVWLVKTRVQIGIKFKFTRSF